MTVLVTGGAGYVGSVTVETLRSRGLRVVVLDNLSRGHRGAVDPDVPFYLGDIGDGDLVERIVRQHGVEACLHFAALAYVGESVTSPGRYFDNNAARSIHLLDALVRTGVRRIVCSSTCAVYGEPDCLPIPDDHSERPVNPYGWSKLFLERLLESYDHAHGLKFVALRYFNAAGASPLHGEWHDPEPHLIPNVLAAARGARSHVVVHGGDYPTPDGTAIRDYVHVADLARAHALALDYLRAGNPSERMNLGSGHGHSVLEVIAMAERVTGRQIRYEIRSRRLGDPAVLVAKSDRARQLLGWSATQSSLETILGSAWAWQRSHPNGYSSETANGQQANGSLPTSVLTRGG